MDASPALSASASAPCMTRCSSPGTTLRIAVSMTPTSSAPTNAPRTEPTPPMTITTKVEIRICSPIPTCTV